MLGGSVRGDLAPPAGPSAPDVPPALVEGNELFTGRTWALEIIKRWRDGRLPVLVLTGDPGTGKSALAAWVAGAGPAPSQADAAESLTHLRADWNAVHFCALEWERGSIDPRDFTDRLARQLAVLPGFTEAAIDALGVHVTINQNVTGADAMVTGIGRLAVHGHSTVDVFRTAVVAPLSGVMTARPELTVAVLLDGLDESLDAPPPTIVELARALLGIPRVRLLVGTRRRQEVLRAMDDGHGRVTYLDLSDPRMRDRSREDVRRYVEARLLAMGRQAEPGDVTALVRAADGNFVYVDYLLDEVEMGLRELTALAGLPETLYGLYDASLNRLRAGREDRWSTEYAPLLGLIAVASPAAPVDVLPQWLGTTAYADVYRRLTELSPVLRDDQTLGGWRIYHRSMVEFLCERQIHRFGGEVPNAWYADPGRWHRQIADHYLGVADAAADGWRAVDEYGARAILHHLTAAARLAADPSERDRLLTRLTALLTDRAFHDAQHARLPQLAPRVVDLRDAVQLVAQHRPVETVLDVAAALSADPRPVVRAVAVETLVRCHEEDAGPTERLLLDQLHGESSTERGAALNVAHRLGPAARGLFLDIARSPDVALRRTAAISLYLLWRPEPDNLTAGVLTEIAHQVRARPTRAMQALLEFLSDLSIAVYANNCDHPSVTGQTSDLWEEVLRSRLHLHLVNRPALDRFLVGVVSRAFSSRMLETALLTELQSGPATFQMTPGQQALAHRVLPLLDPGQSVAAGEDDLLELLGSPLPLMRVVAAMVLNVHAHVDLDETAALATRLFDRAAGDARVWVVLGFTTRLPDAPPGWTSVVENLTERLYEEERGVFCCRGVGTVQELDIKLLPLGITYAQTRTDLPLVSALYERAQAHGDLLARQRLVEVLAPVGLNHPEPVLAFLRPLLGEDAEELADALVACLSVIRVAHPHLVDQLLCDEDTADLRDRVLAATDVQSVWRYVWWLGLYKNAVHQALHYPKMRTALLQGGLRALSDAQSPREFLATYTPVVMRMLREADYRLLRWTET